MRTNAYQRVCQTPSAKTPSYFYCFPRVTSAGGGFGSRIGLWATLIFARAVGQRRLEAREDFLPTSAPICDPRSIGEPRAVADSRSRVRCQDDSARQDFSARPRDSWDSRDLGGSYRSSARDPRKSAFRGSSASRSPATSPCAIYSRGGILGREPDAKPRREIDRRDTVT